jgi:hypothetical protein
MQPLRPVRGASRAGRLHDSWLLGSSGLAGVAVVAAGSIAWIDMAAV